MAEKCKIIIDCDPGVDDAQAILMALDSCNVEIVAITTVFGNTEVNNTTRNVLRLLKFCNRLDISVYKGCGCNLLMEACPCGTYFGVDGFGDVAIPGVDPVDLTLISTEHASAALCRLVSENPGAITLIALGPLTNIATCLQLDGNFGKKLKNCVIMGGNFQGKGNLTPAAEFNFAKDPEAAHAVLEGLQIAVTVVPYETCIQYSAAWDWYEKYTSCGTKLSSLMRDIDLKTVKFLKDRNTSKYLIYDQLAMAAVLDSASVKGVTDVYASVETHGTFSRGMMVIDWSNKLAKTPNIRLVTDVDDEKCKDMMMRSVLKF